MISGTPALATGEIVCTDGAGGNTVEPGANPAASKSAIEAKLFAGGTVCLDGEFTLPGVITFDGNVFIRGTDGSSITSTSGGVFFGDMSEGETLDHITIENLIIENTTDTAVLAYGVTARDSVFAANDEGAINGYSVQVSNSDFLGNLGTGISGDNVEVSNSNFLGNDGGGIDGSNVEVSDSDFSDNLNRAINADSLVVSGSNFRDNFLGDGDGGAIYVDGSATITNSTFEGNVALFGGAVNAGDLVVSNSTFTDNLGIKGGAIWAGIVDVSNSTFEDNVADIAAEGGAIYAEDSATITNSTFEGNEALYGGAVYAVSVDVSNSTFASNAAVGEGSEGGAIYASSGEVYFSTFLENLASDPPLDPEEDTPGNAIYKVGGLQFSLAANIFAGSSAYPQLGFGVSQDPFIDVGGNIFTTSAVTETDIVQEDSIFGASLTSLFGTATPALASNSPNSNGTQTVALVPGSPALDIVPFGVFDNNGSPFNSDQRGALRANPADAGAFELGFLATTGGGTAPWWAVWYSAAMLAIGGLAVAFGRRIRRQNI
jgi:hypothetical protein